MLHRKQWLRASARRNQCLKPEFGATRREGSSLHGVAGIGRSGTFCAVDIALRRLAAADLRDPKAVHNAINIKRIVTALRRQRPGMVQTYDQYLLGYQVRSAACTSC